MLGWHISVYRQADGGDTPAQFDSERSSRLVVWQTGIDGLDWISELAKEGKATSLGGNGYPLRYTAQASILLPEVAEHPPGAREHWVAGPNDVLTEKWDGKTTIDEASISDCDPSEWLIVEAWDES